MENLRSICFVYAKNDSYDVCFVKEFFKWIGFSYAEQMNGSKTNIFETAENCNFDIIAVIDGAMPEMEVAGLKSRLPARIYSEKISRNTSTPEIELLCELLSDITYDVNNDRISNIFKKMLNIYIENHMVDLLYGYTSILYQKMMSIFSEKACRRLENVLQQLDESVDFCQKTSGIEYALYAKYLCRGMVNECLHNQERMERYNIGDLLHEIDNIYTFDKEFYKAEYLKAIVADQSCMYNAQPRFLYENCIRRCKVNVCNSYFYYSLGKWNENNKRLVDALKAFRDSYRLDSNNIKAGFKLAIERKRAGENGMAKKYLQDIIDIWSDSVELGNMPLRDIEYAYKARMLFSLLVDSPFRAEWEQDARRFFDFVDPKQKIEDIPESFFIKRLYNDDGCIQAVLNAMRCRVEFLHEKECFLIGDKDA